MEGVLGLPSQEGKLEEKNLVAENNSRATAISPDCTFPSTCKLPSGLLSNQKAFWARGDNQDVYLDTQSAFLTLVAWVHGPGERGQEGRWQQRCKEGLMVEYLL